MKTCSKCKIKKEFIEFPKNKKLKSGLHSQCRECTRAYYKNNNQKIATPEHKICTGCNLDLPSNKFYLQSHKLDGLSSMCKGCLTKRSVASRFSLDINIYEQMLSSGCEACGSFEKLCIDHDHSCCNYSGSCGNCIRGVLCSDCNSAEGFIKSEKQIDGLKLYMQKHSVI